MTMRLDIVSNDAGELVRREHARDLGANVVIAIYRLAKLAQLHDLANQAFTRQLEQTHAAIVEYGLRAGTNVSILFAQKAVFVAGQLLKGSRSTYEMATELGDILDWCGGSDLSILRDVSQQELYQFAEAVSVAMRSEKGRGYRQPSPKIRLRPVTDAARLRGLEIEQMSHEQRVVRNYASAVVIMRRFFEDLQASRYILPRRIKRVAQNLVDLSEGATPAFLGVTEVRNQNFDDAGRAVNTAILAVAMARELTQDRVLLAQIAMAAMMHDVGRPRAAALGGAGGPRISGVMAKVSEDGEDRLAAGTAAVLTALGRVNEPTITRTVVAYESLWLRRQRFIGPLYRGARAATLHAKIVQIARRYNDLVTPEPGLPPPLPDFAVATLSEELTEPADRTVVRLLVATLGLFPVGTVVQLSTNEVAEIIPGRNPGSPPDQPCVRLVMDAQGGVFNRPIDLDLARQPPNQPPRRIVKVMNVDGWRKGLDSLPASPASGSGMRQVLDSEPPPPPVQPTTRPASHPQAGAGPASPRAGFAPPQHMPQAGPYAGAKSQPGFPSEIPLAAASEPPSASVPSIASIKSISRAAREAPSNPGQHPSGSGVVEISKEGSYPSVGTSPSMVAEAMGRVMSSGPEPQGGKAEVRTVMATSPLEELERKRAENVRRAGGAAPAPQPGAPAPQTGPPPISVRVPMDRPPSARGTLASTPVVHVLVYMLDHGQTGTVVLREPDGTHHLVHFLNGNPMRVRTGKLIAPLGEQLVTHQMLQPEALATAVANAKRSNLLLGQYLVQSGLLSRENLAAQLSLQVANKLGGLVNLPPDTDYAFYADLNLLETWAGGEPSPCLSLNAILACVRTWHDRARIRATLGRIAKQPLSFHPEADFAGLSLYQEERTVIDAIRASQSTLTTLYQQRITDEEIVSSIVYAFAVTRSFAFTAAKGPPMGRRSAPRAPMPDAAGAGPLPVPSVSPGSAPGLGQGGRIPSATAGMPMPSPEVAAALQASKKSSHASAPKPTPPPPVARPTPPPPPEVEVPVHVDGDHGAGEEDETAAAERALQAMTDFRLADTALQRNDLATAERLAKKAVAGDPSNPEYLALVAWLGALSNKKDSLRDALAELHDILKDDALCERALMYRGKLLKRANRHTEALRDFLTVLDVNPKNSEAASEARLLRMKKKK